jgi:hypothetical protein
VTNSIGAMFFRSRKRMTMIQRLVWLVVATSAMTSGCDAKVDLGSHGEGGAPVPLTVLASNQNSPYWIAVDDNNVYWLNNNVLGGVFSVSKSGGAVKTIAGEGFEGFGEMALDSTSIYVPSETNITAFALAGGSSTALAPTLGASAVVVVNGNVYWLDASTLGSDRTLVAKRVAVSGGTPTLIPLPSTISPNDNLFAPDGARMTATSYAVYASLQDGFVQIPLDGSESTFVPIPDFESGAGIAVDDTTIYFGTLGEIASVPLTGGNLSYLAAVHQMVSAVSDGDFLYVVDSNGTLPGRILKVAKEGGSVTTLADNQGAVNSIAVDATSAYWSCTTEGTIKKIGK